MSRLHCALLIASIASSLAYAQDARTGVGEEFDTIEGWSASNTNAPATVEGDGEHLILTDHEGGAVTWGSSVHKVIEGVDLDTYPWLIVRVAEMTGGFNGKLTDLDGGEKITVLRGLLEPGIIAEHIPRATGWSGVVDLSVGLYTRGDGTSITVDYLRFVSELTDEEKEAMPASSHDPDPDPVQGLHTLLERHGHKPWDLYARGDGLLTGRTIFRDRQFGTYVWMLDDSPTPEHCTTASVWPAWNADASLLFLQGTRIGSDGPQRGWFATDEYSRLRPAPATSRVSWDLHNRDILYVHRAGELVEVDASTGESRVVATWEPYPRERIYGLTRDRHHLFLDTPNGGVWTTYDPDPSDPIPQWRLHAGRPEAPGPDGTPRDPHETEEVMHLSRLITTEREPWGHIIRLRTGLLIDRETGEIDPVIAPLSGHYAYLRHFMSDRIDFPTGEGWEDHRIHTSDDMEELYEIYRYYPTITHGHESASPDGEFIGQDGGTTTIYPTRGDGDPLQINLSRNGGHYHLHWVQHPRFFTGWVRGWSFGSFERPENANISFQVFSDGTFQSTVDTKHRLNGYYSGGDFTMLSPDATKIHYGSSMTGRFKNYIAVMARPRPPKTLDWEVEGGAIVLSWEPSDYSRETRGYFVYRSERSGEGYELLTPDEIEGTSWRDETVEVGQSYYYVLTSIEHSGLESGYSAEAARAGIDLPDQVDDPLLVYAETEHAIRDISTTDRPGLAIGVDRWSASDWYYVYRHPESDEGSAHLTTDLPAAGDYHLWARVRSADGESAGWEFSGPGVTWDVATTADAWTWVRAGDAVSLPAGQMEITITTDDAAAQLDLLCLATDSDFEPEGPRPEKTTPPPAVTDLSAENVRERVNALTWQAPDDPTVSYYQVYASEEPIDEVGQELLVGSPTGEEMYDWGLKAGTTYHYAVTAVDRRGNESAIATAQATTPPDDPVVTVELTFADAELEGPFERTEGGATRGAFFVVPEAPEDNAAQWQIDLPRDDDYYLWLRYLHRGSGGRGGGAKQAVRVLLDDEQVATLSAGPDLNVPDTLLAEDHPMAARLWTWLVPGDAELIRVPLPAGEHALRLENLARNVRYDALVITSEPSWKPDDGRLHQG